MKRSLTTSLTAALLLIGQLPAQAADTPARSGAELETVLASDLRPGNVAASPDGRVFITYHALGDAPLQLAEIKDGRAVPYPDLSLQKNGTAPSDATIDSPLGIQVDRRQRLWVIDMGLNLGKTRLWSFDLRKNRALPVIELPADVAPKGSFVQDFAVDERRGWVYLADIANPGLIALELSTGKARRYGGHPSLQSENIDMVIDGKTVAFGGKPARVGVNPLTLSDDRETLYFGAMNGTRWYRLPTRLLREGRSDADIAAAIEVAGPKPISDGVATDRKGRHYYTDLQRHAVSRLSRDGQVRDLVRDPRLNWPDNLSLGPDGWVYVVANQLQLTPAFTGAQDQGRPPYYVYRFKAP
ncbi:L-dopachrome tautomerase-related protein [Lysobacter silvisoli]|uniref:Gluconolactonase n=1 Tax=Lysobacter silvisoli TaxID=2293254 RepID=A0A371JX03_9GAMM|nr:L-dopachrome tautomerase-related protein [Lysobacter silvisoli]RDZ26178.1 hypothetical protein DX914_18060 [Lysobacter silvisoli]